MSVVLITGSAGLIGSESARHFHSLGYEVWGIDNDMRAAFFGADASTGWMRKRLERDLPGYRHFDVDIRDRDAIGELVALGGDSISLVIHTAAQPSHDWAATDPHTDFSVNAVGTLVLLEAVRELSPEAVFIFTSTNKVYGDTPNRLPLVEMDTRFDLPEQHAFSAGIPESMSIDDTLHSLFGVSKAAADLLVQEYGRYFGLNTGVFRGGCLTGSGHAGTELHGFLSYLMQCTVTGRPYTVYGYEGKQVRDNIHSSDLVRAFEQFAKAPRSGAVYNIGGGRHSNCSMLEAIEMCEQISGESLDWTYSDVNRVGDHKWWISDLTRFQSDFPEWQLQHNVPQILEEMYAANIDRWRTDD